MNNRYYNAVRNISHIPLVRLFDHDHVTLANITCFFVDFRCPMMTKRFLFDPGLPTSHGVAHVFLCNGKVSFRCKDCIYTLYIHYFSMYSVIVSDYKDLK